MSSDWWNGPNIQIAVGTRREWVITVFHWNSDWDVRDKIKNLKNNIGGLRPGDTVRLHIVEKRPNM